MKAKNKLLVYNEIVKCVECARELEKCKEPLCVLQSVMTSSTDKIMKILEEVE